MPDSLLPPVLRDARGLGFEAALNAALDQDFAALAVNLPLQAPAAALPVLAQTFHIEGLEGWEFAATEVQQRVLLQNALLSHRLRGTPAALKTALATLGWGVQLEENLPGFIYDGKTLYDGSRTYTDAMQWGAYRVHLTLGEEQAFSSLVAGQIRERLNEQAPARCVLDALVIHLAPVDAFPRPAEAVALVVNQTDTADPIPFTAAPSESYQETSETIAPPTGRGYSRGWCR